ncbi:MAG: nitronate monooxygenase family protein [Elusimicrobia bacterium]|nr:nitronate monooxygenase family protein [Elusimicrobiota bacterium]
MSKLPDLKIGDLRANPPIIQGGMGVRISLANLAATVANEGAIGTIAAALIGGTKSHMKMDEFKNADTKELIAQIRKARSMTKGIIAINVMAGLTNYAELSTAAAKEGIDIIFSGGGLPLNLPKLVKGTKTKVAPIVSSGRTADIICRNWIRKYNHAPDAIVVEGALAGGHLGFSLEELSDETKTPKLEDIVVDVINVAKKFEKESGKKIPVIAAGGIYDGKDIAKFLKLGASGVQMATRFVCTNECDVSQEFKNAYIKAKKEDICIINSPLGMLGRAIKNEFLEKAKRGEIKFECRYQCIKPCIPDKSPYCIGDALVNAANGNLKDGFVFCGANAYRINKIVPVKELIRELVTEAEANY